MLQLQQSKWVLLSKGCGSARMRIRLTIKWEIDVVLSQYVFKSDSSMTLLVDAMKQNGYITIEFEFIVQNSHLAS